jgi:hypothetical protein
VEGSCKHGNELLDVIHGGEFLDQLSDYQLFMELVGLVTLSDSSTTKKRKSAFLIHVKIMDVAVSLALHSCTCYTV